MTVLISHASGRLPSSIHLQGSLVGLVLEGNCIFSRLYSIYDIEKILILPPRLEELIEIPHTHIVSRAFGVVQTHVHVEVLNIISTPAETSGTTGGNEGYD